MTPLPNNETNQTDHRDDHKAGDKRGAEPIIFLSLVEHHLQRSHAQSKQRDTNKVDAHACPLRSPQERRIFYQTHDQEHRQNSYRQVDEEDPAP